MPDDLEKKAREYLIARYGHDGFGTGDMAAFARQVRSETVKECEQVVQDRLNSWKRSSGYSIDERRNELRIVIALIHKKFGSE